MGSQKGRSKFCGQAAKAIRRAAGRARTGDLLMLKQLLYQLSYSGMGPAGGHGVHRQPGKEGEKEGGCGAWATPQDNYRT